MFRNDNITEEAVYNEKNSKMSKRHSHGSSKKSSSKQHRHSSHKHRSQSESNNSNGVDALHVDHDQLGGAANNGSTSCRNFGSEIQRKKFGELFFACTLGILALLIYLCGVLNWKGCQGTCPIERKGRSISINTFLYFNPNVCERLPKKLPKW